MPLPESIQALRNAPDDRTAEISVRELSLQRLLSAYIVTGLFFLLLPGTFLGVWNLIAISEGRSATEISPAWLQAHGHAQIFGWIGSFIIGIGFYSLSKMGGVQTFVVARGWVAGFCGPAESCCAGLQIYMVGSGAECCHCQR